MWEELVPKLVGEYRAYACKNFEEVSFEGTNSPFGNVAVVDARRDIWRDTGKVAFQSSVMT